MIDLYAWTTPDCQEVAIMLEEAECAYTIHLVNLDKAEPLPPDFLTISPNNKLPAIINSEAGGGPMTILESGAILHYLADQSGGLLPAAGPGRLAVLKWLDWQIDELSPMLSQFRHALNNARPESKHAMKRCTDEAARRLRVLDKQLAQTPHVGGAKLTIADIAIYPHMFQVNQHLKDAAGETWRNVERWQESMALRPAVGRGMAAIG